MDVKNCQCYCKKQIDHNFPLYAVKPLAVPLEFWNFDVMSMEDESSKHAVLSESVMST